jgi:hypothetical protein
MIVMKKRNIVLSTLFIVNLQNGVECKAKTLENISELIETADIQIKFQIDQSYAHTIINFLANEQNRHIVSWAKSYHILPNFINAMDLKKGCEIGVAFGTHSQTILEKTAISKLYSVDPYKYFGAQYDDPMNFNQKYFDILHYSVQKRLEDFDQRSSILRLTSEEAAKQFTSQELDFVYIDANHSYEAVKQDLEVWYDKVRSGGLISGDDYGHVNFPGVKLAVDQFFAAKGLKVSQHSDVKEFFWVIKP